jgi:hypothetical protein
VGRRLFVGVGAGGRGREGEREGEGEGEREGAGEQRRLARLAARSRPHTTPAADETSGLATTGRHRSTQHSSRSWQTQLTRPRSSKATVMRSAPVTSRASKGSGSPNRRQRSREGAGVWGCDRRSYPQKMQRSNRAHRQIESAAREAAQPTSRLQDTKGRRRQLTIASARRGLDLGSASNARFHAP